MSRSTTPLLRQNVLGPPGPGCGLRLELLGGFELRRARVPIRLPLNARRLLAFLALQARPRLRAYVAGTLWPDTTEARAHACLRTTLWRLRTADERLVEATGADMGLGRGVAVDAREVGTSAHRVLRGETVGAAEAEALATAGDLLPDWYDEWIPVEREHLRQLRLHALDVLCTNLIAAGRLAEATEVGLASVAGDPLRESAHRLLMTAYLREGNPADAIRQYRLFRAQLRKQLDLAPSPAIEELVRAACGHEASGELGPASAPRARDGIHSVR